MMFNSHKKKILSLELDSGLWNYKIFMSNPDATIIHMSSCIFCAESQS